MFRSVGNTGIRVAAVALLLGAGRAIAEEAYPQLVPENAQIPGKLRKLYTKGKPSAGNPRDGLVLSASLAGPTPVRGQCVPLWLTLKNVTDHDIYLFQYLWDLELQPAGGYSSGCVLVGSDKNLSPIDFLCLKAGQSIDYLMDADVTNHIAPDTRVFRAHLLIGVPENAGRTMGARPGTVFPGGSAILSGPLEIDFGVPAAETGDKDRLVAEFLKNEAELEDKLAVAEDTTAALRRALRKPAGADRWKVFQFLCRHPRPEMADDIVDFLARWGPRDRRRGKLFADETAGGGARGLRKVRLYKLLQNFGRKLPRQRRFSFFYQLARAAPFDWREMGTLVSRFTDTTDQEKLACAARVFLVHIACGRRETDVLSYTAWQLFTNSDDSLRDPQKAAELARLAVEVEPGKLCHRFVLANIVGDDEEVDRIAQIAKDPDQLNSMAWKLAIMYKPTPRQAKLAVAMAKRAVALTAEGHQNYPYILDTLAAAYAAERSYAAALKTQQAAYDWLWPNADPRPEYAKRLVRYVALASLAEPLPGGAYSASLFRGPKVRDALIARLKAEKDKLIRNTICGILKAHFGDDPVARQALTAPPPEPERHPTWEGKDVF